MKYCIMLIFLVQSFLVYSQKTDSLSKQDGQSSTRFSLRQSFQLVSRNDEPAYINLTRPDKGLNSMNFGVALGYDLSKNDQLFDVNLFLESQVNTLVAQKQNTFMAGIVAQGYHKDMAKNGLNWSPYSISKLNYKEDAVHGTNGFQASYYITVLFNKCKKDFCLLPGGVSSGAILEFSYNPYLGFEYEYRGGGSDFSGTTTRAYFRITTTFNLFPKLLNRRLEIIPDWSLRNNIRNTSSAEDLRSDYFKLSFNIVLVQKERSGFADVKLGYDIIDGSDPSKGINNQKYNALNLKIRF
ncbi:hypothetical protein BH09BAC3_BH09BAC3_24720 [soil metagenome]